MRLTDEHLDSLAGTLIPILDEVGNMGKDIHGEDPPLDKHWDPGAIDIGAFTLPEADRLELAIQGQAVMVISTLEQTPDGSSRIVLSPEENWVVKSILMSGLDSSTEIELILVPRI